jgi:hypothetical protein
LANYSSIQYSTWQKQLFGCMMGQSGLWIDLLFGIGRTKLENVKKNGNWEFCPNNEMAIWCSNCSAGQWMVSFFVYSVVSRFYSPKMIAVALVF